MGKWNQKMVLEGRCCNCGKERAPESKRYCEGCLKIHAKQSLAWSKKNKDKVKLLNSQFRPKWRSGKGKEKWSDQKKRWNNRTRKHADNHRLHWEPSEENWLWENRILSRRELAKKLGRTIVAINDHLRILKDKRS